MIINKVNYDLSHIKLPTLTQAKKLCEKFEEPVQGHVLLLTLKPPKKTKGGVSIPDGIKNMIRQKIQEEGVMLVKMCSGLKDSTTFNTKEGNYVIATIAEHDIKAGRALKLGDVEYGAVVVPAYTIVCNVKKPNYE